MSLFNVITRRLVEDGEVELKIHINADITVPELKQKLSLLLSAFSPEEIDVANRVAKKATPRLAKIENDLKEINRELREFGG